MHFTKEQIEILKKQRQKSQDELDIIYKKEEDETRDTSIRE